MDYPCWLDKSYPFENSDDDLLNESKYPQPLKCKCGSDTFRVHVPRFVVTVATCTGCGKSGIIHEG